MFVYLVNMAVVVRRLKRHLVYELLGYLKHLPYNLFSCDE
jgi:hypothetical protein